LSLITIPAPASRLPGSTSDTLPRRLQIPRAWDRGADDHNTFADLNRPAAVVQLRMLTPIPRWIAATSTIREGQPVKVVHYTELVGRHPGTGAKHEYAV